MIFNATNMSFNAIHVNKILAKVSEFTVYVENSYRKYSKFLPLEQLVFLVQPFSLHSISESPLTLYPESHSAGIFDL